MKLALVILAALLPIAACAVEVKGPQGQRLSGWPASIQTETGVIGKPSVEACMARGWTVLTAQEWADETKARQAAQEAAQAQAQAVAAKEAATAYAASYAEEKAKKEEAAKLEAVAAAQAEGGKTPKVETRLDIIEKTLGISWK